MNPPNQFSCMMRVWTQKTSSVQLMQFGLLSLCNTGDSTPSVARHQHSRRAAHHQHKQGWDLRNLDAARKSIVHLGQVT